MIASETCPVAKGTSAAHCWHRRNRTWENCIYPPARDYDEVCCNCGQTRHVHPPAPYDGHGPHHPDRPQTITAYNFTSNRA